MIIEISKSLEADIMNFVKLNYIEDINNFLAGCLRDGFNIAKYGVSPQDNFKKENKPLKIENYDAEKNYTERLEGNEKKKPGGPKKQSGEREENIKQIEKNEESIKPKKTIRIIKK